MLKYYKNFILCGDIDFFCILCNESFELEDEVEKHIRWGQHRRLFKAQEYLHKFKKDCVYKIENRYYCEVCNYVAPFYDIIKRHIKDENHLIRKANPEAAKKQIIAERVLGSIKVSNIYVFKKDWHCVINHQCLLCNIPAYNFNEHITSPDHMIKLIQAEIKVAENGPVYRKFVDDALDTVFCFKCRKTFSEQLFTAHWNEEHGKDKPQKDRLTRLFVIDEENSLVTCILCQTTLDYSWTKLIKHKKDHIKKEEWTPNKKEEKESFYQDKGKLRSELKQYGKDNYIKLNEGGGKGYCSLCHTFISAHIRNFKQHVHGMHHTNHLEVRGLIKKTKKTLKPRYETKPFEELLKDAVRAGVYFFVFNMKLSIHVLSFTLTTRANTKGDNIFCFICGGIYESITVHLESEHKQKLLKVEIITSFTDEYIREIRPGLYHCGICNIAIAGWSILERHLNLFKHCFAKIQSKKRIRLTMTSLQQNILDRNFEAFMSGEDCFD
ncbi:uncharacterized protein LOC126377088 [Pectinophora gossypiella]|uniref:uncharacterized protein LOC126377088 n=1 Tax=Pectinophora gossypiella TaxID=13191 RepID=UPI00214E8565|nr:uncharacterized protein LOC126377088 [Pectinophora gossypiella]